MVTHQLQQKSFPRPSRPHRLPVLPAAVSTANSTQADIRRILRGPCLQTKLTIGVQDDVYEREADRVADEVMRMPEPRLQGPAAPEEQEMELPETTPFVQSQGELGGEEEEGERLQIKPLLQQRLKHGKSIAAETPVFVHDVLRSPGRPLDPATRAFMEPRFGHDLSRVRLHTDGRASQSARAVSARAFTVGRDIEFGTGEYTPETAVGRRLLAHELTHVVQQHGREFRTAQARGDGIYGNSVSEPDAKRIGVAGTHAVGIRVSGARADGLVRLAEAPRDATGRPPDLSAADELALDGHIGRGEGIEPFDRMEPMEPSGTSREAPRLQLSEIAPWKTPDPWDTEPLLDIDPTAAARTALGAETKAFTDLARGRTAKAEAPARFDLPSRWSSTAWPCRSVTCRTRAGWSLADWAVSNTAP